MRGQDIPDDDPAPDPEDPGQLPQRPHPPLRGGDVVDHGNRENGVEAVIFVRKRHVITDKYLEIMFSVLLAQHKSLLLPHCPFLL